MILPFVGDAYAVRSPNLNAQTCINLFPVLDGRGGKTVSALYRTPGLTLFSDDDGLQYSVRGLYELNGVLYAVFDSGFYTVDILGVRTLKGTLNTSIGRVSIISNGLQIGIFDGVNGYTYTLSTNTFAQITDVSFKGCVIAAYQDGYGIYPEPNSEIWWLTDLFDFSNIDALDFAAANQSPDFTVASISSHQELWFFNDVTTEVWYDTGDADFPFERRQTLVIQFGCAAAFSLLKTDNSSLFWLGKNEQSKGVVCRLNGYTPQVISTEAVNEAIDSYERIDDAFAFAYEDKGHLFYILTFPTADRTWVYDITTQLWHERRSQLDNDPIIGLPTRQGRWRPNCYALFNGQHIVGDFESGKLYSIDSDNYTENGIPITWERTAYHLSNEDKWIFLNNFQIILQGGVGLNIGQGSDPQIMVQVSRDYAHTFENEIWVPVGRQGQFRHRALIPALGASRDWVIRIRGTDPVFQAILGVKAESEVTS